MSDRSPEFDAWVADAKAASIEAVALAMPELRLKKAGRDLNGPCPACNSTDSFIITPGKEPSKQFLCRKVGKGGDVIAMVAHALGIEPKGKGFLMICERILNRPPPDRKVETRPRNIDADRERAKQRRDDEATRALADEKAEAFSAAKAAELFATGQPFAGSHAEAYLKARKIVLRREQQTDLRFAPRIPYWGWETYEKGALTVHLGDFPAMLAAFRLPDGTVSGCHITYLDPNDPKKLTPPGTTDNKAKKIRGPYMGGLIMLGPVKPIMAIGEGIETTASWYDLDQTPAGVNPDHVGIAAAGSMGNLCGGPTEMVKPIYPTKRGSVPNGIADMDKPGFRWLPNVEGYVFLQDGDSEREWTQRCIMTALDRARRDDLRAWAQAAPSGLDFNDYARRVA